MCFDTCKICCLPRITELVNNNEQGTYCPRGTLKAGTGHENKTIQNCNSELKHIEKERQLDIVRVKRVAVRLKPQQIAGQDFLCLLLKQVVLTAAV